jgi:spore germination protein YaaH
MINGLGYLIEDRKDRKDREDRKDSGARGLLVAGAVALGLAATGGAAPAWASTQRSVPAKRPAPLQAFVLASAPDSLADLEAHAHDVGLVYPTYFECEPGTGAIAGEGGDEGSAEAAAITAYARARGIAVMPRFNCQDGPTVHTILTEPRARARTLAGLVQIASSPAYAGVNLDLENDVPTDRAALTSFVTALARELHPRAKKLSVDIDGVTHDNPAIATGLYDDRAIAAAADYVFVIAWGTHWEGSAPGPIAPLSYVSAVARYVASLPHGNRFVLGAPMYGLDWPVPAASSRRQRASALQYANVLTLARATGASPVLDRSVDEPTFAYTRAGVRHRVWYMDAQSVADRLRIAREHGLAVGVWRLGGEDQALWSSPPVVEGPLG